MVVLLVLPKPRIILGTPLATTQKYLSSLCFYQGSRIILSWLRGQGGLKQVNPTESKLSFSSWAMHWVATWETGCFFFAFALQNLGIFGLEFTIGAKEPFFWPTTAAGWGEAIPSMRQGGGLEVGVGLGQNLILSYSLWRKQPEVGIALALVVLEHSLVWKTS